jgi:hypothetical protein
VTDASVPPPDPQPPSTPAPGTPPPAQAGQWVPAKASGVIGQPRSIGISILLAIVTCGVYTWVWSYKTYDEMKQHTGEGVGGTIGLLLDFFVRPVTFFLVPSEIRQMYQRDGRTTDLTPLWGLWILLPILGPFIWFFKVQGTLNDYWVSKGATPR